MVKHSILRPFITSIIAVLCLWNTCAGAPVVLPVKKIAVISPMEIRPFVEAVSGFTEALFSIGGYSIDTFDLRKYTDGAETILRRQLTEGGYDLCLAVGPEAAQFSADQALPFIYTMILSPEKIKGTGMALCGLSLRIPVEEQVQTIYRSVPGIHSIGLLFDRRYNNDFFFEAKREAGQYGLEIIPLEVTSKREIPNALKESWSKIDSLWFIPDETVISESVIEFINKEAILKKIPTIGFNRYFYDLGSLISFVFDYKSLGKQTADLVLSIQSGEYCTGESPRYSLFINERVMNRLGVRVVSDTDTSRKRAP